MRAVVLVLVCLLLPALPNSDADCPAGCFCDKRRADRDRESLLPRQVSLTPRHILAVASLV